MTNEGLITNEGLLRLLFIIKTGIENIADDLAVDSNGSFDIEDYVHQKKWLGELMLVLDGKTKVG
jgi:hypothetical protein